MTDESTSRARSNTLSPSQQRRIERQAQLCAAVRDAGLSRRVPYVGHLRLDTGPRETDVLLGDATRITSGVSLIDWRTAPLAEVFFACDEGDDYELALEDRIVTGRVVEKNWVTFSSGCLARIETSSETFARSSDGAWQQVPHSGPPGITPRPASARKPFRSPLEVTLDSAQQGIVDLSPRKDVLILGEAGFGKTTVALHRLLAMQRQGGPRFRGAVVVPTDGLRRLTQLMLERRGAEGIEVWLYDRWASAAAHRAFPDLPRRESMNASAAVIRLKRHRALREVLAELVRARPSRTRRSDLEHLFGDRELMARVVAGAGSGLTAAAISEVTEHTRIQFLQRAEVELADVDADRLATADGRSIDEGTPTEDAMSVDTEDYAVMFELERLRAVAQKTRPLSIAEYDCLVVDETQELAPLERVLIGRALKPQGTLIVAGDAAQQLDPTTDFAGWGTVMEEFGAENYLQAALEVSYRCPSDVTALARSILDGRAPAVSSEASIVRARHETSFHLLAWLGRELQKIEATDRAASIAVIARAPAVARFYARVLGHSISMRLALDGDFDFEPGITVTCVQEVKGLEYDYVVVPDADAVTYPPTAEARRNLYVAVTRATDRLVLAASGNWSALLGA